MNTSIIAVRYAKAFFLLGKEKNKLDVFVQDIQLLDTLIAENTDLWLMLESPVVKASQKKSVIKQLLEKTVDQLTIQFIDMIIANKRELFLKDIARVFLAMYRKEQGIIATTLTTASPLDKVSREKMQEKLSKAFNGTIEITEKVDQTLIGGFVIRVEDLQLDASVTNQLKTIKRELLMQ